MKVKLLRSAVTTQHDVPSQYLTSYVINRHLAVDAGCVGFVGEPGQQAQIRHVLLSHTHLDHIASLPIFLENAYEARHDCVTIYCSEDVETCLRHDIFNNRVWPDFIALSPPEAPFLKLQRIVSGQPFQIDGLHITPVAVQHVVPTMGFVIRDDHSSIAIVSDTGPTSDIWEEVNRAPQLRAVFLEVTFPNALTPIAEVSQHLTPAMLAGEARKLSQPTRIIAVHLKARYQTEIQQELRALGLPHLECVEFDKCYEF